MKILPDWKTDKAVVGHVVCALLNMLKSIFLDIKQKIHLKLQLRDIILSHVKKIKESIQIESYEKSLPCVIGILWTQEAERS